MLKSFRIDDVQMEGWQELHLKDRSGANYAGCCDSNVSFDFISQANAPVIKQLFLSSKLILLYPLLVCWDSDSHVSPFPAGFMQDYANRKY